jgi:hypothetical protein
MTISFNINTTNSSCGNLTKQVYFVHTGSYYSFFPNPTTGELWIEAEEDKDIKIKHEEGNEFNVIVKPGLDEIILLDKEGHFIMNRKLPAKSKKARISLDGLKPDVYVVIVKDGNVMVEERIIKN